MSRSRVGWHCALVFLGTMVARAHLHAMKLLILGAASLGSMYMLHYLAQDFNKIMNSWNKGPGNHINQQLGNIFQLSNTWSNYWTNGRRKRSTNEDWLMKTFPNDTRLMSNLVENDTIGCARKYVCYISSKSLKKQTATEKNVLGMLRLFQWLDNGGEWTKAQEAGRTAGGCEAAYPRCRFSGTQLQRLMALFG